MLSLVILAGVSDLHPEHDPEWTFPKALIRGFHFPLSDYTENLDILRAHREAFSRLVDAQAPLDGLPELFAEFAAGRRLKPIAAPA